EDYTGEELMLIAKSMFQSSKASLSKGAEEHLTAYFKFLYKYRDRYFGNARSARQLVSDVLRRHDLRKSRSKNQQKGNKAIRIAKADVDHLVLDPKTLSIQRKQIGF
ncbi:MAG: AAA family ATPase, partial [Bacteroidota bacterium]